MLLFASVSRQNSQFEGAIMGAKIVAYKWHTNTIKNFAIILTTSKKVAWSQSLKTVLYIVANAVEDIALWESITT